MAFEPHKEIMTTQSRVYTEASVSQSPTNSTEGRSTTETIEAAVPELKVKLRQMVETGKSRVTEWKGGFQDGIRQRPIQSVLIATAVGAVIGLIVGRRSR
jgi:ElaB/YqjD/DUF883 family membrane-anchored ribosome-binding protein